MKLILEGSFRVYYTKVMCETVQPNLKLIVLKFVYERQVFFLIHGKVLIHSDINFTALFSSIFFTKTINQGQCDFIGENVYFGIKSRLATEKYNQRIDIGNKAIIRKRKSVKMICSW